MRWRSVPELWIGSLSTPTSNYLFVSLRRASLQDDTWRWGGGEVGAWVIQENRP